MALYAQIAQTVWGKELVAAPGRELLVFLELARAMIPPSDEVTWRALVECLYRRFNSTKICHLGRHLQKHGSAFKLYAEVLPYYSHNFEGVLEAHRFVLTGATVLQPAPSPPFAAPQSQEWHGSGLEASPSLASFGRVPVGPGLALRAPEAMAAVPARLKAVATKPVPPAGPPPQELLAQWRASIGEVEPLRTPLESVAPTTPPLQQTPKRPRRDAWGGAPEESGRRFTPQPPRSWPRCSPPLNRQATGAAGQRWEEADKENWSWDGGWGAPPRS